MVIQLVLLTGEGSVANSFYLGKQNVPVSSLVAGSSIPANMATENFTSCGIKGASACSGNIPWRCCCCTLC